MSGSSGGGLANEVVRASAGAGKTYQLTTRYLRLISLGEPARHVLATTFTRKAAGEVLGRVLGRLAEACADEVKRSELSAALGGSALSRARCVGMLRSLVDELSRLSVGTIDGFFNRAARALSLELGLPVDFRLTDEQSPIARQLRTDAIYAVLGEKAAGEEGMHALIEMLRRLHHDTAQRSVAEAIDSIVRGLSDTYLAYPDRSLWDALPETGLLSGDLLTAALELLVSMEPALPKTKAGGVNKTFARAYGVLVEDAFADRWDAVLGNGLIERAGRADESERVFGRVAIEGEWYRVLRPIVAHARAKRLRALADQTLATFDLLELFDAQYQSLKHSRRVLLFSDLTHLLADGLPSMEGSGVEELCFRLDTRVTHLLLDEFQDTSLRQWAVLAPFAEEIVATGDGTRSLYCVGDTKQAIYGWRGGCAELFEKVEGMQTVERQTLSRSWRSSQAVLDAVNRVFGSLSGNAALSKCERAAVNWQAGFETHSAVRDELPGHVVLHSTASDDAAASRDQHVGDDSDDDDDVTAPADAHARFTARYIQRLTEAHPGRSIGVLMRSRSKARLLMHELRSLGVRAAEEGGNPIDSVPAVSAVLSAVQLADHPGDAVARFHVANTPMGGVVGLTGADAKPTDVVARSIRRSLLDEGYAAVIAGWVRELAPSCDARSLGRLMQLVELAERFDEEDAGLRPGFFVDAARAAKVEDASPARVRVMTVHGSKGLEFDAVVLLELDATLSRHDQSGLIVLDRDSPIGEVRGVFRRVRDNEADLVPALRRAHDQQAYESRTEDLCLLYVAMTRARQALHMLVRPVKIGSKGRPRTAGLTNLSYAAVLRQALCDEPGEGEDPSGGEVLYELGDAGWSGGGGVAGVVPGESEASAQAQPMPAIALVSHAGSRGRSWLQTTPSQMHDRGAVSAVDLLGLSKSAGMAYGTVVHAMLERVGFVDEGLPGDEVLLAAGGAVAVDAGGGVDRGAALAQVKRALATPAVHELLGRRGADELWRERGFVARLGGRLVRGTFDRVHLWREGGGIVRAHLIDYKTDRVDDDTVDAVVAGYADQLGLYREALCAMLGFEADAVSVSLCFVGDARVVGLG